MTRLLLPVSLAAAVLLIVGWDGGPGRTGGTVLRASRPVPALSGAALTEPVQPSRRLVQRAAPDAGTLPQTHELPRSDDPAFRARVAMLWQAVVSDDPELALPFFFPQAAYVQIKDIWDPVGDYQYRLVGYYKLDVHAAHALLGADAGRARLLGAEVPTSAAEWMPPGAEENKGSYYRVYGTRIRYQVGGTTKSFGVFSMLSWRGQWYGIHFGPWPRWTRVGAVG